MPDIPASTSHPDIPGLVIARGALGSEHRHAILSAMASAGWFAGDRNQVMRFGSIPSFLDPVSDAGRRVISVGERPFNQLIANRYSRGDGLKSHVDLARFADGIIVASIKGTCSFTFQRVDGQGEPIEVFMGPGDVIGLQGEARWDWTHGIPYRMEDVVDGEKIERTERISVTLRYMEPDKD